MLRLCHTPETNGQPVRPRRLPNLARTGDGGVQAVEWVGCCQEDNP